MFGCFNKNVQTGGAIPRHRQSHVRFPHNAFYPMLTQCSEPIARANSCAVVRTYTGHGINDLFHTAPNIPHYAKNKAVGAMKPGMVSELPETYQCHSFIHSSVLYH
jgi:methionine aminopeptidase